MRDFSVNVISSKENGKIPVYVAGQVMVDVQQLLMDIGEYLTSRALRVQKSMKSELLSRFILYMGADGGISLDTSVDVPEVERFGNIVDDALALTESAMEAMGSGAGGYWMEDNFADAFYRKHIIYDIVSLSQHLAAFPECSLMYGPAENPKKFGQVDVQKMAAFVREKGNIGVGATIGLITSSQSKSKGIRLSLVSGENRARLTFADSDSEKAALALADKGPVMIGGRLVVDDEGNLTEILDAGGVTAAENIMFHRLLAANGDVVLAHPLKANIIYDSGKWTLKNPETGISVTHDSWDETVQAFHDQMVFLWVEYADSEKQFEGEEAEIRDYLLSLAQ